MTRACSHIGLDNTDFATKALHNTLCSPGAFLSRSAKLAPLSCGKTQLSQRQTPDSTFGPFIYFSNAETGQQKPVSMAC